MAEEQKSDVEKKIKIRFRRTKKFYASHKKTFWSILVTLTIIMFFFGAKIILYANLMLGNDIILTLTTPKQDFHLKNGETENITFVAKVKINPFCKAICTSSFEDISKGETLKKDEFSLSTQIPLKLNYVMKADMLGGGQKLYRETLVCRSSETTFCQTFGDNTSRSILITLNHELNENQVKLKESLLLRLNESKRDIESSYSIINAINNSLSNSSNVAEIKSILSEMEKLKSESRSKEVKLEQLYALWGNEDYDAIMKNQLLEIPQTKQSFESLYALANTTVNKQNELKDEYDNSGETFLNLSKIEIDNAAVIDSLTSDFKQYESLKALFEKSNTLAEKEAAISDMKDLEVKIETISTNELNAEIRLKREKLVETYTRLCELGYDCIDTKYLDKLENLGGLCSETTKMNDLFRKISGSTPTTANTQTQPPASTANLSKSELDRLKRLFGTKNGELIINTTAPTGQTAQSGNSALFDFVQTPLVECSIKSIPVTLAPKKDIQKIKLLPISRYNLNLSFEHQGKKCCVNGECEKCCGDGLCENEAYPVLFLHGHSFNKRLEAEYSLDAFNKLQNALEKDGYINAGAISLYSVQDGISSDWKNIPAPLSIKVSYYYDIFKTQKDYVLVQTKSENIDTYALRLNDLINDILKKTGKKKVTIISHSMGGLVTRRYVQIFGGEKIDKFIMIATPNNGVTGAIANYCALVGEEQECTDLKADSLFLNKLNRDKMTGNVDSYVIYGTGCDTDGEDGDGVVSAKNAKLEYTQNIEIKGNCTGINTLHTDILDITKYPKVYKEISNILI